MKLEIRPKDPRIKEILKLAKAGEMDVKLFKTKTVIYIKREATAKSKNLFKKILKTTDTYNLMTWIY